MSDPLLPAAGSSHPGFARIRRILGVLLAIFVVVAVIAAKPPNKMVIETGPVGGSYYHDAEAYKKVLAERGITLKLVAKPNSLEIIHDVADNRTGIDIGFVAQDVSGETTSHQYTLGETEMQPLFIFSNADLGRRSTLDDLRGRRIVMPPNDSATSDAAIRVFKLYDITPDNTQFAFMPLDQAVKALRAGQFDAGAFMLAPDNQVIRDLTSDSGLHLVPVTAAKAVANHLPFLRAVVLPRGIYSIADAIPPSDVAMVAAPVNIIIRKGLHPYLVYALLDALADVHRAPTFISAAGDFPTIAGSQLPPHPMAVEYYRSGVPWLYRALSPWPASVIDRYQLLIFVVILVAALMLSVRYLAHYIGHLLVVCLHWSERWRGRRREQHSSAPDALKAR